MHGFQYLFWEAIARADYVSRWFGDVRNPNTMIAFTWPSAGELAEYQPRLDLFDDSPALPSPDAGNPESLIDDFRT